MNTPATVKVYVCCEDEDERGRFDDLLVQLSSQWLSVEEVARAQFADVALVLHAEPTTAIEALKRAGCDAAIVWVDAQAGGHVEQAWACGCDERIGLLDAPLTWTRTLRMLGLTRQARRKATAARATYRDAVRGSGSGGWIWDLATGGIRFDPAWKATLGYTDEECSDDTEAWFTRIHAHDRATVRAALESLIGGHNRSVDLEHRIQCRDRSYLWVHVHGELRSDAHGLRIEGTQVDISAQKLTALRLADADRCDRLTGGLTRHAFLLALDARVADASRPFALGICDIDHLKRLNRRWGRPAGDEVLLWLAGLFEDRLGDNGCWGRIGSDKFAFVIEGDGLPDFAAFAATLREEFGAEVFAATAGSEFQASVTVAIVECPDVVKDGSDLLQLVDRALDQAHESGEGIWLLTRDAFDLAAANTLRVVAATED